MWRFLSSNATRGTNAKTTTLTKLHYLDLRGTGLSILERLCLEEALLRHDPLQRSWIIVGTHEPVRNRFLPQLPPPPPSSSSHHNHYHPECVIVLGIGGKPHEMLNTQNVQTDTVLLLKRFSGGGTVVLEPSSIVTTIIGRNDDFPNVLPYPRDIMTWSADTIFRPVFESWKRDMERNGYPIKRRVGGEGGGGVRSLLTEDELKSYGVSPSSSQQQNSTTNNTHPTIPTFQLIENDYVLGNRKMGGNAQSIIKNGWLHHTSFLWDYNDSYMNYLSLPPKRPEYRRHRSHDDFLVRLKDYFDGHPQKQRALFRHLQRVVEQKFAVERVTMKEALGIVEEEVGGLQVWFDGKCRTRIVEL